MLGAARGSPISRRSRRARTYGVWPHALLALGELLYHTENVWFRSQSALAARSAR